MEHFTEEVSAAPYSQAVLAGADLRFDNGLKTGLKKGDILTS